MPEKTQKYQSLKRRKPVQERAQEKIELILEAATRIIDQDGLEGLTTNRVAELAGISIGTLYQYFGDKAEIIVMLGQREVNAVTDKVIATLATPVVGPPGESARMLIDGVFGAFGGRSKVHRVLLEYALQKGRSSSLDASPNRIADLLASARVTRADGQGLRFSPEEAFVLTHAFTGVIRASIGPNASDMSLENIKSALLTLILSFVNATNAVDASRLKK
jgi:AcrR family transcriptional regulator